MARILVGASDGLHVFANGEKHEHRFANQRVIALAPRGRDLWAMLDGREIWRTDADRSAHVGDLGTLRGNCLADTRAGVLVGTAEARLYRVEGEGIEFVPAFDRVERRDTWYTPWGGPPDSRSISEDDDAVYVNVHVGGIVRSRDRGASWEPTIDIDADVHRVWAGASRVFAACARGLAESRDGGDSWTMRGEGLHASYCRGVTVCGDTVLLSASNGPRGGRAALYRGRLDGGAFERCSVGLPEWFDGNIDSAWLDAAPELAAFGTPDGRVFASTDEGGTWSEVVSGLSSIECVLVAP